MEIDVYSIIYFSTIVIFAFFGFFLWVVSHKQKLRQEHLTAKRLEEQKKQNKFQTKSYDYSRHQNTYLGFIKTIQGFEIRHTHDLEVVDIILSGQPVSKITKRYSRRNIDFTVASANTLYVWASELRILKTSISIFRKTEIKKTDVKNKLSKLTKELAAMADAIDNVHLYIIDNLLEEKSRINRKQLDESLSVFVKAAKKGMTPTSRRMLSHLTKEIEGCMGI